MSDSDVSQPLIPSAQSHASHGLSQVAAVAFSINLIIGSGFVIIPHVVANAGILLGCITLLVAGWLCDVSKDALLDAMALGQAHHAHDPACLSQPLPTTRRIEATDLLRRFLGPAWNHGYVVVLTLWATGTLWGFSAVVGTTMAALWPAPLQIPWAGDATPGPCNIDADANCAPTYRGWVLMFALVVIPLTCLRMREQKWLQMLLAAGRVAVLACMTIVVVVAATSCDVSPFVQVGADWHPYTTLAKPSGLTVLLPIAVTTTLFHESISTVAVAVAEPSKLRATFRYAFIVVTSSYVLMSSALGWYFGSNLQTQSTLEFRGYVGCAAATEFHAAGKSVIPAQLMQLDRPWWAWAIVYYVLIFPAIDVVSAFPLNAIALANNVLVAVQGEAGATPDDMLLVEEGSEEDETAGSTSSLPRDAARVRVEVVGLAQDKSGAGRLGSTAQPNWHQVAAAGGIQSTGSDDEQHMLLHRHGPEVRVVPWYMQWWHAVQRIARHHALDRYTYAARAAAALPPLIGACVVHDLGRIVEITGTFGVIVAFTVPFVLLLAGSVKVRRTFPGLDSVDTRYTASLLRTGGAKKCAAIAATLLFPVIVCLVGIEWAQGD